MKVLICDDQAIIRDGMELLLKLEKDIEVVGKASNGAEALQLVAELRPDLVLMDLKMPVINGIEATQRIQQQFPEVKVLVLTTFEEDEWLFDALRAGAAGYLLKDTPRADLVKAIRGTIEGKTYMDPAVAGRLVEQAINQATRPASLVTGKLTEREIAVLRLLAGGLSNAGDRPRTPSFQRHRAQPRQRHLRQAGSHRPYAGRADCHPPRPGLLEGCMVHLLQRS